MRLGEKLRYLRTIEGSLRGLGRPLTQMEVARAIHRQSRASFSQSYLSQVENGTRHLTPATRRVLAEFFKVHPGFLVDDPEGYHSELTSDLRAAEGQLDGWLLRAAERFASDRELSDALLNVARHEDSRACVLLLGAIVETPGLAERLLDTLRPELTRSVPSAGRGEEAAP